MSLIASETVQIGTQCWTKTNLRTTKFRNGNPIPEDVDPDQSSSASFSRASSADVLLDYPAYTDSTFGFYYNWYAAVDTGNSKLCPDGWHVPNDGDWMVLSSYLRANYACGNNLSNNAKAMADSLMWASNGVDCSIGNILENNNASGFTAFPAGYLSYGSHYPMFIEALANFWTAMPSVDNLSAKYYSMYHTDKNLQSYDHPKSQLLSVRCIMDDTTTIVKPVVTTDSTSAVTTISAKLHGTIINPNSIVIVKKGFEWKTVLKFGANTIENSTSVTAVPYALNARFAADLDPNSAALTAVYDRIQQDSAALHDALKDTAIAIRGAIPVVPPQVNADWSATSGPAEIYNKPDINNGRLIITLPDGTEKIFTANQAGNTEVVIPPYTVTPQDILDAAGQMTPAQKAAMRQALGVDGTSSGNPQP